MSRVRWTLSLFLVFGLAACRVMGEGSSDDAAAPQTPGSAGSQLLPRLLGLWTGPGKNTPLGEFPIMNMDLRPADPYTLFGRSDLDADNNLRFAFAMERSASGDRLVFRNGGYFQGILRDTRAELVDAVSGLPSPTPRLSDAGGYRFCAIARGCGYLDATWSFPASDRLELAVRVRGQPHLAWSARRLEDRPVGSRFPADDAAHSDENSPFPAMPSLRLRVDWSDPLMVPADVWVVLSRDGCGLSGCNVSRSLMTAATTGTQSAELVIEQLHAGDYQVMALLDRDRSFRSTLSPSRGDGVTLPLNTIVQLPATGETQRTLRIGFTVP